MEIRTINENADARVSLKGWLWYLSQGEQCRFDLGFESEFRRRDTSRNGTLDSGDVSGWLSEKVVIGIGGETVFVEANARVELELEADNLARHIVNVLNTDGNGVLRWRDIRANTLVMAHRINDLTKWCLRFQCSARLRYMSKERNNRSYGFYRGKLFKTLWTRLKPLITTHCIDAMDAKTLVTKTVSNMIAATRAPHKSSLHALSRIDNLLVNFGRLEEEMVMFALSMRAKKQREIERNLLEQHRAQRRMEKLKKRQARVSLDVKKRSIRFPLHETSCDAWSPLTTAGQQRLDSTQPKTSSTSKASSSRQSIMESTSTLSRSMPTIRLQSSTRRSSAGLPSSTVVRSVPAAWLTPVKASRRSTFAQFSNVPVHVTKESSHGVSGARASSTTSVDVEKARKAAARRVSHVKKREQLAKMMKENTALDNSSCGVGDGASMCESSGAVDRKEITKGSTRKTAVKGTTA